MADSTNQNSDRSTVSRRRMLLATGGAAGVLAGCGGGGGDGGDGGDGGGDDGDGGDGTTTTTTTTTTTEQPVVDQIFKAHMWVNPANVQFNPYALKNTSSHLFNLLYDDLALYNPSESKFGKFGATDWALDGRQFTITLREGMTWHNGDPVTAEDVATKLRIDKFLDLPVSSFVDSIETMGERTTRLNLSKTTNPDVLAQTVLPTKLNAPHGLFQDQLEAIQDASSSKEEDSVRQDILNYTIPPNESYGNGPFQLESTNNQYAESSRYADHYWADQINFTTVRNQYQSSNQQNWQAIKAGDQDLSWTAMPESVRKSLPDYVRRYFYTPFFGGGVQFQHDDPVFGDVRVRKAIGNIINRPPVGKNAGGYYPVDVPSGIGGVNINKPDEWLGDLQSSFNTYGPKPDRAAKLLRDAGYAKQNGTWQKDGSALSAGLKVPAGYSDWVKGTQTIVGQLKSFGLEISMETVEATTYWGSMFPNGNFRLCMNSWAQGPFPYFSFNNLFASSGAENAYHYPTEIEVPPVGKPNGTPQTVNPKALTQELAQTTDQNRVTEIIRKLAWAVNQDLVMFPVWEQYGHYFVSGDDWELPSRDDLDTATNMAVYWMMRQGDVQPKQK